MLSWLRAKCPLNADEQTWIEYRLSWLLDQLGHERLRAMNTVPPTGEFFPLPYQGEPDEARAVFARVCEYLQVDSENYRLRLVDDPEGFALPSVPREHKWIIWPDHVVFESAKMGSGTASAASGEEPPPLATFHLARALAGDLETLIAILAREICRSLLLEEGRLSPGRIEFEHTVELMPLFFGLGIFSANAVMRDTFHDALGVHTWRMINQGTLPSRYVGYALAVLLWLREDSLPAWRSHLRRDAEDTLRAAHKYLEKTGDTILDRKPAANAKPYQQRPVKLLLDDLRTGTPGRRVAALWAIQERPTEISPGEAVARIAENLAHPDPVVRAQAAGTLEALGQTATGAVPELLEALTDRNASVRTASALALGTLHGQHEEVVPALLPVLEDRNLTTANAAAWAVGQFGRDARIAAAPLIKLLRRVILHCEKGVNLDELLEALLAVADDPEAAIQETLFERDEETCAHLLNLLREHRLDQAGARGQGPEVRGGKSE